MAKRNFIITVVLMLLIVALTSFADDRYQWKLVDTDDGCQIYTSPVSGKEYIAAKTSCVVPARKEVLAVVLRDIENYPEWMEDCKEAKILKVVDDQNDVLIFWLRQHIQLFPDRDMVLKSKTIMDPSKGQDIIYADLNNEIKHDTGKGYVRMPSFHSVWTLDWIDREHTRVTFMIDPDLAAGLPKSFANGKIKDSPIKSLKKLMKMVKTPKYIEAAKTSKYNKLVEDGIKNGFLK
jgi:ribosome-associated toxin RatA of RatAB toxin-antitoxin module